MKTVDGKALHDRAQRKWREAARGCLHIARDTSGMGSWVCLHPSRPDPELQGMYAVCELAWRGECECGGIEETADEG